MHQQKVIFKKHYEITETIELTRAVDEPQVSPKKEHGIWKTILGCLSWVSYLVKPVQWLIEHLSNTPK